MRSRNKQISRCLERQRCYPSRRGKTANSSHGFASRVPARVVGESLSLTLYGGLWLAHAAVRRVLFLNPEDETLPEEAVSIDTMFYRMRFIQCALVVAGLVAVFRLYDLQGQEYQKWNKIASRQHETQITVSGARGTILDAAGRMLAVSVPAVAVGAHPRDISDPAASARALAPLLGQDETELAARLRDTRSFVWLARGLPKETEQRLADTGLKGVHTYPEFRRYYPQGQLLGPVLGRVSRDGDGQSGIEMQLNRRLQAAGYSLPVRRDAKGRYVTANAWNSAQQGEGVRGLFAAAMRPKDAVFAGSFFRNEGTDISLSIDSVMQNIVEQEFEVGRKDSEARRVFGVVMDAETGELLALAQTGGFDPNKFVNVAPTDLRNIVVQDNFEPGSTMKPLVAAVALDRGNVGRDEIMNCENGHYRFGKRSIRDVHPIGIVPLSEVLVQSSNICMAKIGARMGAEGLHDALQVLGFGAYTEIELPGEAKGILRSVNNWKTIDIATHSFGQGVAVTALQLTRAYAALANGGKLVRPTLIKQDRSVINSAPQILKPETANAIGVMLRGVTDGATGTGRRAKIEGLNVPGKTGTAEKARVDGRGYDPDKVLASFIGFVDAREVGVERSLVMFVAVDEPGVRPRWGGTLAGPIFRRAMERIVSHLMATDGGAPLRTAASLRKTSSNS